MSLDLWRGELAIKGVLFDKDGTLIQFEPMWISITERVLQDLFKKFSINHLYKELFLESVGVKEGKIDGRGILAMKTAFDVAITWYEIMIKNSIYYELDEVKVYVKNRFNYYSLHEDSQIYPICGTKELLSYLKDKNIVLGVATADTRKSTLHSLRKAGLLEYFDYIGSDDGLSIKKPNTSMADKFCTDFSISKDELLIVGDTICDMEFGKNVGCKFFGVLSGAGTFLELKKYTENIITSVASLRDVDF